MAFLGKRPFKIVSQMNGKVLDIKKGSTSPGADVIMYKPKHGLEAKNQLWYLDDNGIIRSILNDFALEGKGKGDKIEMEPFNGSPKQMWIFDGNRIINRINRNECLDIKGNDKSDGATVVVWEYKGQSNQQWRQEFV